MKRLTMKPHNQVLLKACYRDCWKEPLTGFHCQILDCEHMRQVAERLYQLEEMIAKGELIRVDPGSNTKNKEDTKHV